MAKPGGIHTTELAKRGAIYALLFCLALVFVFPFYWLFISAFKSPDQIFTIPPQFLPETWRLDNFRDVFAKTKILRAFANSTLIAAGHCSLSVLLCAMGGYAFAKFPNAPGRAKLFAFVLGTMMIPGEVTLIPSFIIMVKLGLVNSYWALIIPGAANAFGIFWMRQYIAGNVPDALLDAARVDGCGEVAMFFRVVMPVIRPALAALLILRLMYSWNNLMWAFIMLRTEEMQTMPLLIYLLQGERNTPYGMLMAGCLLITLPLIIAFVLFQKHFIGGITAGAVKG
ncbi:MAG TPA: carbohydrate ABC transporter permease [Candidatus Brocadiia bacterium]|nr:carbohydrate ABC transporter permease [Candidatus Brocadiia bacterium]